MKHGPSNSINEISIWKAAIQTKASEAWPAKLNANEISICKAVIKLKPVKHGPPNSKKCLDSTRFKRDLCATSENQKNTIIATIERMGLHATKKG